MMLKRMFILMCILAVSWPTLILIVFKLGYPKQAENIWNVFPADEWQREFILAFMILTGMSALAFIALSITMLLGKTKAKSLFIPTTGLIFGASGFILAALVADMSEGGWGAIYKIKQSREAEQKLKTIKETDRAKAIAKKREYTSTLTAGETFQDCDVCPLMVVIPSGTITIGHQNKSEMEWNDLPAQNYALTKKLGIGKFELTFEQWDHCLEERVCIKGGYNQDQGCSWQKAINDVG